MLKGGRHRGTERDGRRIVPPGIVAAAVDRFLT
jgi:hypothetical protein